MAIRLSNGEVIGYDAGNNKTVVIRQGDMTAPRWRVPSVPIPFTEKPVGDPMITPPTSYPDPDLSPVSPRMTPPPIPQGDPVTAFPTKSPNVPVSPIAYIPTTVQGGTSGGGGMSAPGYTPGTSSGGTSGTSSGGDDLARQTRDASLLSALASLFPSQASSALSPYTSEFAPTGGGEVVPTDAQDNRRKLLLIAIVLGVGGYFWYRHHKKKTHAAASH